MNKIKFLIDKYKGISIPAKASMWYAICNILQKGISFLTIPVYVRILTTAEYGQYAVFQSWRDILVIFATLNLYCGVFTKAMVDYEDDRDRYTSCMQGLSTLITGLFFVIYLIKHEFWNSLFELDTITMLLMFAYFVTYPALSFWSVRQRVEYKYVTMVIVTLFVAVITPVVSIILLMCTDLRELAVIWGYLIVQILFGGFFYVLQWIKGKKACVLSYWKHAIAFNIPLIPHYLSIIVLGQADRIMIKDMCGEDKAGIYSLAYQVSMIMNLFLSAINGSLVPWTYENLKKKNYTRIAQLSTKLCLVMGVLTLMVAMVAPEIIWILGSHEYAEAKWIVPVVALSVYFTFCYSLFSNVEFYYGETKLIMVASISGAILNIVLNYIFIPLFGYIAAGYTTFVCYVFFALLHYIFMRKMCRTYIDGVHVFDIKKMLLISVALIAGSAISMLFYELTLVRYIFIAVIAIICLLNAKQIVSLIRNMKN